MASQSKFAKAARACRSEGVTEGKAMFRCVAAHGGLGGARRKKAPSGRSFSPAQKASQRRFSAAAKGCKGSGSMAKHNACVRAALKGGGNGNRGANGRHRLAPDDPNQYGRGNGREMVSGLSGYLGR